MISGLFKDQRPLMVAGLGFLLGGFVLLALATFDSTQILGISRWIKPMKFFMSVAVFLWTIAIYLRYLPGHARFSRIVTWSMLVIFALELVAVVGQSIRGTTSHFNISTPFDGMIFAAMGILISINTLLVVAILVAYFRVKIEFPRAVLWGMRLGLIVFLFGSIQGGYMSAHLSHTVGAADGGPGLPLTNWSTIAGDLRVAHFMGLHSLQAIPIVGVLLERFRIGNRLILTVGFAAAYFALFMLMFVQALLGRPLIAM